MHLVDQMKKGRKAKRHMSIKEFYLPAFSCFLQIHQDDL